MPAGSTFHSVGTIALGLACGNLFAKSSISKAGSGVAALVLTSIFSLADEQGSVT